MYKLPEPTRPSPDLLSEGVQIPGWTVVTWTAVGPRLAWPPESHSRAETAECTCPKDCVRDHEND
jgi:hypothetical protein